MIRTIIEEFDPSRVCRIYNGYETIDADKCDWAMGTCPHPVNAIVALRDPDEPAAATHTRRPLCAEHLGTCVTSYTRSRVGVIEVWPVTDEDLADMWINRVAPNKLYAEDLPGYHPSDRPHYYVPEL